MLSYNHDTEGSAIIDAFLKSVQGKTFLITGPSEGGLGAETAISLAAGNPAQLILVGRSAEKIDPVVDAIRKAATSPVKVKTFLTEFDSIASIRSTAQSILSDTDIERIDGVINNAGVMGVANFQKTTDGIEEHLGINHISHFLLTNLLMPRFSSKKTRIVNVSSYGHIFANVNFDDATFENGTTYNPWEAYGASKTANILFTVELNKRFGNVQAFAVSPGSIHTKLGRHITPETMKTGLEIHKNNNVPRPPPKTLQQGISTGLRALLDPTLATKTGVYLNDCEIVTNSNELAPHAVDPDNAHRCWILSEALVGEKFPA